MANYLSRRQQVQPIYGVKVSEDHGQSWGTRALCDECYKSIEPPKLAKKEIPAGSYRCDWCGCRNSMYGELKSRV
jgi:hypothetical protein